MSYFFHFVSGSRFKAAATAFKTGEYGGTTYSGKYGDMAAMTAAIMLDPEARASILDSDNAHGQMREPVLKVMHMLRSLEYKSKSEMEINLFKLGESIGQFAFQSPSVFNFYLPEFSPAGPVQEAGLVAPEAQIATAPYLIGYLNGVSSLIDNGLTSCHRGFGDHNGQISGGRYCHMPQGSDSIVRRSDGVLSFTPSDPTHPAKAVDEMALLLTGGRLGKKTREVLTHVYDSYVHEQAFDIAAGVKQSFAALDDYLIPEEECLYAVQKKLAIPLPVAATCEASSEFDHRFSCTNALDDNHETAWATRSNLEGPPHGTLSTAEAECVVQVKKALPPGTVQGRNHLSKGTWGHLPSGCSYKTGGDNSAFFNSNEAGKPHVDFTEVAADPANHKGTWIKVLFEAGATVIDRMGYKQRGGSEKNKDVLLEFSDGSSQTVTLWNNDSRGIFQLAPVNTSFVTVTVKSAYNAVGNNGAKELHFYKPGGSPFKDQGRTHLISGTWKYVPKGCSMHGNDQAAHFNKDDTGCNGPNCGGYRSVLAAGSENVFMPSQSSRNQFGPFEAVDSKTGYDFNHWGSKSCVHTQTETSPWYQIDLGSMQNITTVLYHARRCGGACNTNTHGFAVYVDNTRIAANVEPNAGEVLRFEVYQMGRVVKIMNPGEDKLITFCELEVNVAQAPDAGGRYLSRPDAEAKALKHTLKLLTLSPDFHATNFHNTKPVQRTPPPKQVSQGRKYKAVVVVFLEGGADSFNVVVPHGGDGATSNCKAPIKDDGSDGGNGDGGGRARKAATEFEEHDLYGEYQKERGAEEALTKASLLQVEVPGDGQPCKTFGLHPSFKRIQGLYNDGDAALLANMGGLVEPLTLEDYTKREKKLPPGVFAHNMMQKNAWTVHAENRDAKGMLGRMVTKLTNRSAPFKSAMYSLKGYQRMLTGAPFTPAIIAAGEGIVRFGDYSNLKDDINSMINLESESLMAETYAAVLESSIESTEFLGKALGNTTLKSGNDFASKVLVNGAVGRNHLAEQLKEVSKVIQLDTTDFGNERSMFYTSIGGWDSHGSVDISTQLDHVDEAVGMLADELKDQGVWDDVAVVCLSDFGRTLNSNSQGTDHGWGGNYWIAGGKVKGAQMLGKYPHRFTEFESDLNVGRGRFIPTTPWESIWNAVGEWLELDEEELVDVLPHKENFPNADIFTKEQVFEN